MFQIMIMTSLENVTEELYSEEDSITEYQSRFSVALHLLLPVAGLMFILFHQKTLLNKILLQIDRNCVSVFCPSFSRRERLLKWACNRLPSTWSSQSKTLSGGISDLWQDGSLLCTLVNTAIPGACPNPHRHWKKPPTHAQAIAYKYFGLVPMFTDEELSKGLTSNLERNFLHYLNELQQAVNKLSEKTTSINTVSDKYIPRGMGLFSGEQHRKVTFYVYQDATIKSEIDSTVIIQIRGPYGTYGQAVIPRFHDGLFKIPDVKIMTDFANTTKFKSKTHFMKSFAISFMRYHKKHMGDNIVIDVTMEEDRARVTYIPRNYGMYEINMVANGELLKGSPFNVHILKNTSGIEDNFDVEDKIFRVPTFKKRKVISKTINFVEGKTPVKQIKENSTTKTSEKINKTSESPKKASIHFADVVSEIGSLQLNSDQNRSKYLEKHADSNLENSEELKDRKINKDIDEQNNRRDALFQNISTIEEEIEEQELLHHDDESEKDEYVAHEPVPPNRTIEEIRPVLNAASQVDDDMPSSNDNIQKQQFALSEMQSEIPNFITKIRIPISDNNKEKFFNEYSNFKDDISKHKISTPLENTLVTTELAQTDANVTEEKQKNPASTHTFRRYSPPSVKLEEYTARAKVNKLKIPDKFISEKDLESKDLKNLINNSSKIKSKAFNIPNELLPKTEAVHAIEKVYSNSLKNDYVNNNKNNNTTFDNRIKNDITKKDTCIKKERVFVESESNAWNPNGNVKKLLQNYQQQPSEDVNIIKQNNIRNLHRKIKPIPQDIDIRQEFCQLVQKRNVEPKQPINATVSPDRRIFPNSVKQEFKSFGNDLSKNISHSNPSILHTSPICANHIVPEVSYEQMSVAEKRKIFAQSTLEGRTSSSSYSSSDNENDVKNIKSKSNGHLQFEGLSVMHVLGSLKKSENSDKGKFYPVSSLPNITDLPDEYIFPCVVKDKKNFWEEVSTRSSSSLSTTPSIKNKLPEKNIELEKNIWKNPATDINDKSSVDFPDSHRSVDDLTSEMSMDFNSLQYSTEDESINYSLPNMSFDSNIATTMSVKERKFFWEQFHPRSASSLSDGSAKERKPHYGTQKMRSVWSKPEELARGNLVEKTGGIYKSENNILSLESTHYYSLKKCKSVDDSLDNCTILSIAERKKMLLNSDGFKVNSDQHEKTTNYVKVNAKEPKQQSSYLINAISRRTEDDNTHKNNIKMNSSTQNKKEVFKDSNQKTSTYSPTTKKLPSHTHFKKAIKYFRNLEAKSQGRPMPEKPNKLTDLKKFSLEVSRRKNRKKGGSLNLPKLSSRFALANIYDDVFGSGRSSFRGVPNRSALVEALATFSRSDETPCYKEDAEDDIRFDLFKKRMKPKKRKSLKSVFDVCY